LIVPDAYASNVTGNRTSRVTINGPLAGVNAALDGLIYRTPAGFSGPATLTMTTNDLGNRGAGGPLADIDQLEIEIGLASPVTADIVNVLPDPRAAAVSQIVVQFSRAVTGLDLSDLTLTRTTDAAISLLPGTATVTTSDNIEWTIGNLQQLTSASGIYRLTLTANGSGIRALDGGPLVEDALESWVHGAGDVNGDRQFNTIDLVTVLQADRYLTGQPAGWSQGDWNGDGIFNPLDIVLAQQTQPYHYLQGPFAARAPAAVDPGARLVDSWHAAGEADRAARPAVPDVDDLLDDRFRAWQLADQPHDDPRSIDAALEQFQM
jgi:hypothetical protein